MIDPFTERLIKMGMDSDKDASDVAINKCNCMVRYASGTQLPAVRKGKEFFTPDGEKITSPDSFEEMKPHAIKALMTKRGDIYIGHMFTRLRPS